MSYRKNRNISRTRASKTIIRTTFFDLIGKLLDTNPDDAAVIAALRQLFDHGNARMVRLFAPVRLQS